MGPDRPDRNAGMIRQHFCMGLTSPSYGQGSHEASTAGPDSTVSAAKDILSEDPTVKQEQKRKEAEAQGQAQAPESAAVRRAWCTEVQRVNIHEEHPQRQAEAQSHAAPADLETRSTTRTLSSDERSPLQLEGIRSRSRLPAEPIQQEAEAQSKRVTHLGPRNVTLPTPERSLQNIEGTQLNRRFQSHDELISSSAAQHRASVIATASSNIVGFCRSLVSDSTPSDPSPESVSGDGSGSKSKSKSAKLRSKFRIPGFVAWASIPSNTDDAQTKFGDLGQKSYPAASSGDSPEEAFSCLGGQIQWDVGVTDFCVIPHTADPQEFMACPTYQRWNMKKPNLVVSVMGGAGHMNQESSKYDTFKQGIVSAAMKTHAWILTGGTASGVMDLVGRAMKLHDKQRQVPCIGVTAYGSLAQSWRDALENRSNEGDVQPPEPQREFDLDPVTKVPLAHIQPNHTHVILCRSEKSGSVAFGTEVDFRVKLEKHLGEAAGSRKKSKGADRTGELSQLASEVISLVNCEVPRVMILVNGGSISLVSVDNAIKSGCPVVCVCGSGRAADAIVTLLEGKTEAEALEHMKPEVLDDSKKEMLRRIKNSECVQVHRSNDRLEDIILKAVLDNPSSQSSELAPQPQELLSAAWHKLVLAVQWRLESYYERLARDLIKHCRNTCSFSPVTPRAHAQDHQLQAGMNLATQLLFTGFVGENRFNIVQSDQSLSPHDRGAGLNIVPLLEFFRQNHKFQLERFKVNAATLGNIEWNCIPDVSKDGFPGLLLWAVEQEAYESVLDSLWTHTPDPVHAALVAASACRNIAESKHGHKSYSNDLAKKRLEGVATRFEKLAVQVLEDLAAANVMSSVDYLFEPSRFWGRRDCFHIATFLNCKDFVASKFYRMAVDRYYRTPAPFAENKGNKDSMLADLSWISLFQVGTRMKTSNLSVEKFYRVPYIKAITHAISRIVFIATYASAVFLGLFITTRTHWVEAFLFVFGISLARIELKQYNAKKSFWAYLDFWNALDCVHITVLLATIIGGQFLKDSSTMSSREEYGLEIAHAINLLPSFMRLLQVFQLSEYFGTLVLTVAGMISDAAYFFVLLAIFCMMFSCALTPILFQQSDTRQKQGLTWAFWSIFGEVDDAAKQQLDGEWQSVVLRELTRGLMYLLCLVSNVLLMNLLIAVMGSTYDRNKENSETEWAFYQATAWMDYDDVSMMPPPLNLLEDIADFVQARRKPIEKKCEVGSVSDNALATKASRHLDGLVPSSIDFIASAKKAIATLSTEGDAGSELESLKRENEELRKQNSELRRLFELEHRNAEQLQQKVSELVHEETSAPNSPRRPSVRRTSSS